MKQKLFTLFMLLVAVTTGAWAQDPDFSVGATALTTSTFLGTDAASGITLSSSASYSSGAVQIGNTASSYDSNYFEVLSSGAAIEKVSFLISGNGSNKSIQAPVFGWEETATSNTADTYSILDAVTVTANSYAAAQWFEYDFSGYDMKCLRIYRSTRQISSTDPEYTGSSTQLGSGQTIKIYGVKVWLKSADGKTNLVGEWSDDAPTFEYGATATIPTFSVTPATATAGTDYSVAYSLVSGSNVTVDATNGITAIDTETAGTSVVKATITVVNEENYKATTTEYETTITVNEEQTTPTGDEHTITFNGKDEGDTDYFTNVGKHSFNAKFNGATYDGTTFTSGLKMENTTEIDFTTTATATVIIVQSTWSDKGITFDGIGHPSSEAVAGTGCRVYTISNVAAGVHKVTRGSDGESGLFQITVIEESVPSTDPVITASNVSITATESGVAATQTIDVTGANLTGTTLTATLNPTVEGLSVSLASDAITDGAITTTATLSYTATANANGTTTLTISDGTTSKDVTITYHAQVVDYVQKTVSAATTWDFSKTGLSSKIEFASDDPQYRTDVLIANIKGYNVVPDFDAESLIFNGDRLDTSYGQVKALKFKTSVPGTVQVVFSNTGGSRPYRHVKVNDVLSSEGSASGSANDKTSEAILVPAGDVTIIGYIPDATNPQERDGDVVGQSFLRVYKVIFTPLADETITFDETGGNATKVSANAGQTANVFVSRKISADYYNTLYLPFAMSAAQITAAFGDGAQVATFTGEIKNETSFQFANVTAMEAYTGYLVKPAATVNGFTVEGATISSTVPSVETDWAMIGTLDNFANSTENGDIYYFTTSGTVKKLSATGNIKGLRAFMCNKETATSIITSISSNAGLTFGGGSTEPALADEFVFYISIDGDDDVTAINAIDGVPVLDANAPIYNLAGQRVGQSYKGVVIQNGKKFVIK